MSSLDRVKITARQFYELYDEASEPIELIDGEVIVSPAPRDIHQRVLRKLVALFSVPVDEASLGELRMSPSDVHLDEYDVVQPDLFFVSKDNPNCQLGEDDYWHGAPDLCLEVLSASTRKLDRVTKFGLYQKHGVREYWIVDTLDRFIEVYVLDGETYRRHGTYTEKDTLTSVILPELVIQLSQVFPE
ncbi:MAG: Uma2 family endonuclease [Anaerolineae bacterium]|nr:Uma2 family endonuclease [Anaerolineae bacterium]